MESMMVGGVGGVGSVGSVGGFQLVREPTSGALLLLPAAPELPHTLVWGGVGYPSAPLLLPPAPHAHATHPLLLPGDLLTSATLQHTHTHSTRLVALAPAPAPAAPQPTHPPPAHLGEKRKTLLQPLLPQHALIKIEPEPTHDKPEQVTMPLTTHLYYQPQSDGTGPVGAVTTTIAVEGQGQNQGCRSQGTSPVAPATPPDGSEEAPATPAHRDASNQTDQIDDDEEIVPPYENERDLACVGVAHQPNVHRDSPHLDSADSSIGHQSSLESLAPSNVVGAIEKAIDAIERDEALTDITSSNTTGHEIVIDSSCTSSAPVLLAPARPLVDVSGLELLSNSIEQFERTTPAAPLPTSTGHLSIAPPLTVDTRGPLPGVIIKCSPKSPPSTGTDSHRRFEFPSDTDDRTKPSFDGLGLLCALAEQRFMEEVERPATTSTTAPLLRPYIKSEPLLSPTDVSQKGPESSLKDKKERHRHRDGESSGERRHKRSREREDRLRHKLEKVRRHKRERDHDSDRSVLEDSLRRVTACSCGTSTCAHSTGVHSALFSAMEKDMRERLRDLQRQCDEKLAQLDALAPTAAPSTPPAPSPDSDRSSSKKRKVGRPRKVSSPDSTETIVAKKPKSKSSLVGYLLAKGRLKGGIVCSRTEPPRDHAYRTSKVRPKLKAEPIVKAYSEEDESEWPLDRSASSSMESLNEVRLKNRQNTDRLARKHSRDELPALVVSHRLSADVDTDSDKERRRAKKRRKSIKLKELTPNDESKTEKKDGNIGEVTVAEQRSRCTLTETLLDTGPRVLTAMGGLFYAGRLSAVRAPDVYAITLDGERGNKPHILSREETLRDAILEVNPSSAAELRAGTRVCAYWSQQYRCLYPGTVAEDPPTDPGDKFVAVEFDDGDSGRIALEDIRLLEPNYPVVEYDVNPLLTLGKRRRNTSVNSTEDKRSAVSTISIPVLDQLKPINTSVSENAPQKTSSDDDRHKKKLKKHRKEKLKRSHSDEKESVAEAYVKKKKKKHKCCGERCKRRHHKKHHRKHRKRHHSGCREHSSSSGDDQHRHRSSSEYQDSSKNEDSGDSNDRLSTLIAVEKSPDDKMKTVIKKAVLSKKALVKNAVLDFSNLGQLVDKKDESAKTDVKDNLKDSGIGMEEDAPIATDGNKKVVCGRCLSSTRTHRSMEWKREIACSALSLARSAQAECDNESCFFVLSSIYKTLSRQKPVKKKKHRSVSSTSSDAVANANSGSGGAGTSGGVSKMAAFLPGGALWRWSGAAYRRMARPRHRKLFYRAIQRGDETLAYSDSWSNFLVLRGRYTHARSSKITSFARIRVGKIVHAKTRKRARAFTRDKSGAGRLTSCIRRLLFLTL
ncbi:Protein winged eye [Eumeta japonica]|uniref:Protein winged eye n=1 Tax=Eumeta variegata TaxID=151549 RepID=A0A4C1Z943_EUMVA|nr:Protein winged eye [Eumeta japonica]